MRPMSWMGKATFGCADVALQMASLCRRTGSAAGTKSARKRDEALIAQAIPAPRTHPAAGCNRRNRGKLGDGCVMDFAAAVAAHGRTET